MKPAHMSPILGSGKRWISRDTVVLVVEDRVPSLPDYSEIIAPPGSWVAALSRYFSESHAEDLCEGILALGWK